VIEGQTKVVATALHVENRLREHQVFTNHRKEMDRAIQKAKRFEQGTDAIQQVDHSVML
jgi:hypothetical protein